jgi:hypothetical protein
MANAGGNDAYQHFTGLGALNVHFFDGEGFARFPGNGGA